MRTQIIFFWSFDENSRQWLPVRVSMDPPLRQKKYGPLCKCPPPLSKEETRPGPLTWGGVGTIAVRILDWCGISPRGNSLYGNPLPCSYSFLPPPPTPPHIGLCAVPPGGSGHRTACMRLCPAHRPAASSTHYSIACTLAALPAPSFLALYKLRGRGWGGTAGGCTLMRPHLRLRRHASCKS